MCGTTVFASLCVDPSHHHPREKKKKKNPNEKERRLDRLNNPRRRRVVRCIRLKVEDEKTHSGRQRDKKKKVIFSFFFLHLRLFSLISSLVFFFFFDISLLFSLVINCEFFSRGKNHKMLIWSLYHLWYLNCFIEREKETRLVCRIATNENGNVLSIRFAVVLWSIETLRWLFGLFSWSINKKIWTIETNVVMMLIVKFK